MQLDALRAAGCSPVFEENESGAHRSRPQLDRALAELRSGDTLVVWKLDRLGRSLRDLLDVSESLRERNVALRSLTEHIDTATAAGKMLYAVLGAVAQFERDVLRERTIAGHACRKEPWRANRPAAGAHVACAFVALLGGAALVGCGGGGAVASSLATCGSPPPSAPPRLLLIYPISGATEVPDALGEAIFLGPYSSVTVGISSSGGSIPLGAPTAAPSPLPSPNAIPSNYGPGSAPFVAVPVPTLSPATTYTVDYAYEDYADNPPLCKAQVTLQLGTFTTQ